MSGDGLKVNKQNNKKGISMKKRDLYKKFI